MLNYISFNIFLFLYIKITIVFILIFSFKGILLFLLFINNISTLYFTVERVIKVLILLTLAILGIVINKFNK